MGGRLSMPKAADGLSEVPKASTNRLHRNKGIVNGRTIMAPLAAFTMASLLFVYARTSIRAAKLNAQKHREADGGQISWHKESMRRHGMAERLDDDRGTFKEALMGDVARSRKERLEKEKREKVEKERVEEAGTERSDNDRELRGLLGKRG
ncbi:hypothetical protein HBI56_118460 [Parastagonospora nodorum]|nr:hypothetical protein HBH53_097200 [Parastagonospora nodorum]KAH3988590.1 hypothetical protein HBH52_030720 [Parastagonospora nodorum]KAH3993219.1 hypothetical protein HBI10_206060 [Parastagonospora nodorum]KAH4011218.1 hypothetical protein HBI13_201810 [Parastagonospora nodorum]KAH4037521.1 hypothetical protein HBI09_071690 [Parastagonospora nodorum]